MDRNNVISVGLIGAGDAPDPLKSTLPVKARGLSGLRALAIATGHVTVFDNAFWHDFVERASLAGSGGGAAPGAGNVGSGGNAPNETVFPTPDPYTP